MAPMMPEAPALNADCNTQAGRNRRHISGNWWRVLLAVFHEDEQPVDG
jgi:hypothetical protein